jgi:hypothetical protein
VFLFAEIDLATTFSSPPDARNSMSARFCAGVGGRRKFRMTSNIVLVPEARRPLGFEAVTLTILSVVPTDLVDTNPLMR